MTLTYAQFVALHSRPATRGWHCVCTITGILLSLLVLSTLGNGLVEDWLGYLESERLQPMSQWWHAAIWGAVCVCIRGRQLFWEVVFNFRMTWDTLRAA